LAVTLPVTVTTFGFLKVITQLVSCGVEVAAIQVEPLFVDICHVKAAFQFPVAILLTVHLLNMKFP